MFKKTLCLLYSTNIQSIHESINSFLFEMILNDKLIIYTKNKFNWQVSYSICFSPFSYHQHSNYIVEREYINWKDNYTIFLNYPNPKIFFNLNWNSNSKLRFYQNSTKRNFYKKSHSIFWPFWKLNENEIINISVLYIAWVYYRTMVSSSKEIENDVWCTEVILTFWMALFRYINVLAVTL